MPSSKCWAAWRYTLIWSTLPAPWIFGNVFIQSILIIEIINKMDLCSFKSLQKSVMSPNIWSVYLHKSKTYSQYQNPKTLSALVQQTWKFMEVLLCILIPNWYLRAEGQSTNQDTLGCRATMLQWFWHYFLMSEKITDLVGTCTQRPLATLQPEQLFRSSGLVKWDWCFFSTMTACSTEFSLFYMQFCPRWTCSAPMLGEAMLKYLEQSLFSPQHHLL